MNVRPSEQNPCRLQTPPVTCFHPQQLIWQFIIHNEQSGLQHIIRDLEELTLQI